MGTEFGVVIIAVGDSSYGRMATVLAASIKKNTPHVPICVLYTEGSLLGLSPRQMDLFDERVLVPEEDYQWNGGVMYQKVKTKLYKHSPFDATLYIDADSIICPGRKVTEWVEGLKDAELTFYANGYYDFEADKGYRDDYLYWALPHDIKERYGLSDNSILPQLQASFIYFRKCAKAKEFFSTADWVYDAPDPVNNEWGGGMPDEYAFNISMALMGIGPHQYPYRPLYIHFLSGQLTQAGIIDKFVGMSNAGNALPDRLAEIYNEWSAYYFAEFGFQTNFFHVNKKDVINNREDW